MEDYLITKLGVSQSQIMALHDEKATRKGILDALQEIETNPSIDKDDPILIYFAGHGVTAEAPPGWNSTGSKVQLIVPQDSVEVGSDIEPLIPDRTIAALLNKISKTKGNNIVSHSCLSTPIFIHSL